MKVKGVMMALVLVAGLIGWIVDAEEKSKRANEQEEIQRIADEKRHQEEEEQFARKIHDPICKECGKTYFAHMGKSLTLYGQPYKICYREDCYYMALARIAESRGYRSTRSHY